MPELSMDAKRDLIRGKLDPDKNHDIWVREVYDAKVIVEDDGKLYEYPYSISEENEVTLGARKEVVVSYEALGELKDIEVLRAGTFTSMSGEVVTYTEDDLAEIEKNNNALNAQLQPPIVATHNEGGNTSIQVFGYVDGGKFHNFRKVGERLLADLKNMPKKAMDLLAEVKEFRLSPEVYKNFSDQGKAYGRAIRRVSVVDIPAIKGMTPVSEANLFEEAPDQPTTWVLLSEQPQSKSGKEEEDMKIDLSKMSEGEILKLGEKDIASLSEGDARYVVLLQEKDRLEQENKSHTTKLSEHAQAAKTAKIGTIVAKFQDKDGKEVLAPAAVDSIKQFAESLDSTTTIKLGEGDAAVEKTPLDMFGDLLDNLIQRSDKGTLVVHLGEMAGDVDSHGDGDEYAQTVETIASAGGE